MGAVGPIIIEAKAQQVIGRVALVVCNVARRHVSKHFAWKSVGKRYVGVGDRLVGIRSGCGPIVVA